MENPEWNDGILHQLFAKGWELSVFDDRKIESFQVAVAGC